MTAETDTADGQGAVRMSPPPGGPPPGGSSPEGGTPITERPEALVGGAFAGGLVLALILKRLGR